MADFRLRALGVGPHAFCFAAASAGSRGLACWGCSMSGLSLSEPDFLLIRASDLKSVLVMLEAASFWRSSSQHARAAQCSRSAIGLLVNLANSSKSLGDFVAERALEGVPPAPAVLVSLRDGAAGAGGIPEFVTPPSNTGVNKSKPGARGF